MQHVLMNGDQWLLSPAYEAASSIEESVSSSMSYRDQFLKTAVSRWLEWHGNNSTRIFPLFNVLQLARVFCNDTGSYVCHCKIRYLCGKKVLYLRVIAWVHDLLLYGPTAAFISTNLYVEMQLLVHTEIIVEQLRQGYYHIPATSLLEHSTYY